MGLNDIRASRSQLKPHFDLVEATLCRSKLLAAVPVARTRILGSKIQGLDTSVASGTFHKPGV